MDGSISFNKALPFIILPLIFAPGCNNQKEYHTKSTTQAVTIQKRIKKALNQEEPVQTQRTVTIWIHGTRSASRVVFPKFFYAVDGLHHASAYGPKNNLFSVAQGLSQSDPDQFPYDDIFMFGWSGKLSATARIEAAKKLYAELVQLVDRYKQKYGIVPQIRMITHSHGGNVAMYLAEISKEHDVKIKIDELDLLACPVQRRTMHMLKNPIFKKIYSFYSKQDVMQVLDPQGVYDIKDIWNGKKRRRRRNPFFSERRFPKQDNMQQIQVRMTGWRLFHPHLQFILEKFVKNLPKILTDLRNGESENLVKKFGKRIRVVLDVDESAMDPDLEVESQLLA